MPKATARDEQWRVALSSLSFTSGQKYSALLRFSVNSCMSLCIHLCRTNTSHVDSAIQLKMTCKILDQGGQLSSSHCKAKCPSTGVMYMGPCNVFISRVFARFFGCIKRKRVDSPSNLVSPSKILPWNPRCVGLATVTVILPSNNAGRIHVIIYISDMLGFLPLLVYKISYETLPQLEGQEYHVIVYIVLRSVWLNHERKIIFGRPLWIAPSAKLTPNNKSAPAIQRSSTYSSPWCFSSFIRPFRNRESCSFISFLEDAGRSERLPSCGRQLYIEVIFELSNAFFSCLGRTSEDSGADRPNSYHFPHLMVNLLLNVVWNLVVGVSDFKFKPFTWKDGMGGFFSSIQCLALHSRSLQCSCLRHILSIKFSAVSLTSAWPLLIAFLPMQISFPLYGCLAF